MTIVGKRVLVTRARKQAGMLSRALQRAGAVAVEFPVIAIAPPQDPEPFRIAVAEIERFDWLVMTSANGVEALFEELQRQQRDALLLQGLRVAAIGPATARSLTDRGIAVETMPEEYRGEEVALAIGQKHRGDMRGVRVLLARAAGAREVLPDMLRQAGALVQVVEAYQAVAPAESERERLREMFERGEIDSVTFTSSSTVRNTLQMLGTDGLRLLSGVTVASIGPITTATAEQCGIKIDVTASEYTIDGLVEALSRFYR